MRVDAANEAFLLTPRECADLAVLGALIRKANCLHGAGVPDHFGVVAVGVAPVGDGLRVTHLGLLVVVLHHLQLGRIHLKCGIADAWRSHRHEQVTHRRLIAHAADELTHHAQSAAT